MWPNPQFHADLVTFTKEILNRKLHILCSDYAYLKIIFWLLNRLWTALNKFFVKNVEILEKF